MNIGTSGTEVTIGTATTRMRHRGISVQKNTLPRDASSGDVCIATAATIYATDEGIYVDDDPMTGTITVYNTGDLTTGGRGIYARNGNGGSDDVTVANSGTIMTANEAIHAASYSTGTVSVSVTNSGALGRAATATTVASRVSNGIHALHQRGAAGTVSVTNSGDITASGWGILATTRGSADVTVRLTGGSIDANGTRNAVEADHPGLAGSVTITVSAGATAVSRRHAGIAARSTHGDNAAGTIAVTQGGTIMGRTGVLAYATRASADGETRASSAQPLIDVTWTGSFLHGTTVTVAPDDTGRRAAANAEQALDAARVVDAEGVTRHGQAAGIEAFALDPWDAATTVATGDDPGADADAAVQTALMAASGAGSMRAEIVAAFKAALGNEDLAVAEAVFGAIKTGATSLDDVTDAEIVTYLSADNAGRRTFLRNILAKSLSDEEKAVLRAVATNTGLDAALTAAGFTDDTSDDEDYWSRVKALLDRYNVGNIRVRVNEGSIVSRGDGVRAYYATPHDMNGRIDVTIAAGTTVTGGMAGIYVANAGMGTVSASTPTSPSSWGNALYLAEDTTLRQQFVTVNGKVTGGTDAAVHLSGGGALLVGERGEVAAGSSGTAILVNEPGRAEIVVRGTVRGGEGADAAIDGMGGGSVTVGLTGRVDPNGATRAIRARVAPGSTATTRVVLGNTQAEGGLYREDANAALARAGGASGVGGDGLANDQVVFGLTDSNGSTGQEVVNLALADGAVSTAGLPCRDCPPPDGMTPETPDGMTPGTPDGMTPGTPSRVMNCGEASDRRCRLYAALPSMLLAMNDLPTYAERMSAARDGKGGWVRVETAGGKWKADSSKETDAYGSRQTDPDVVAYDHRRHGVRAGMDFAVGEAGRVGVSVHGLRGSAEMTQGGGEVDLSGRGAGVNATAMAGGVHIDVQAAASWYDADLTSMLGDKLKDGAKGTGYALGVEASLPMAVREGVTLTPRIGFAWSRVSLDEFKDSRLDTSVSVKEADSQMGRVGLMVETAVGSEDAPGRVFGSVDVEHEFEDETNVYVLNTTLLAATARPGSVRLGLGGEFSLDEGVMLRARADYTRSGSGTNEYGGGVELNVRFQARIAKRSPGARASSACALSVRAPVLGQRGRRRVALAAGEAHHPAVTALADPVRDELPDAVAADLVRIHPARHRRRARLGDRGLVARRLPHGAQQLRWKPAIRIRRDARAGDRRGGALVPLPNPAEPEPGAGCEPGSAGVPPASPCGGPPVHGPPVYTCGRDARAPRRAVLRAAVAEGLCGRDARVVRRAVPGIGTDPWFRLRRVGDSKKEVSPGW